MTDFDLWTNHKDCLDGNSNPKKRYFSEREAKNAALYLKEVHGVLLRVYQCDNCGYWHLTKSVQFAVEKHTEFHSLVIGSSGNQGAIDCFNHNWTYDTRNAHATRHLTKQLHEIRTHKSCNYFESLNYA